MENLIIRKIEKEAARKDTKKNSLIQKLMQGQEIKLGRLTVVGFYYHK